eukprot:EG_transcript_17486
MVPAEELRQHAVEGRVTFEDGPSGPRARLQHPAGAHCHVYLQGAHVTDWVTANGHQAMYSSPAAVYTPGKAIRGGIPVCWPQFNDMGSLPAHGILRTQTNFTVHTAGASDGATTLTLRSQSDESTRRQWPHEYDLRYTVRLSATDLVCELEATNTGVESWTFTTALHTYFTVGDINKCSVTGVGGLEYYDNLEGRVKKTHDPSEEPFHVDQEVDRIYLAVTAPLKIHDEISGTVTTVAQTGFTDAVVWNPWVAKCRAIGDLPDDAYRHFLCIESATVLSTDPDRRASLAPRATWRGAMTLSCH